ncbi:MAG TPA: NAD(P)H-binding protein [Polyangiaceae bacterium]|nr:NAD(P)H-binding protein [Polyangiaceae bacterium]
MKISILGASRGTGALAVQVALARGHDVLAFARTPDKLALSHPKLTKLRGDFHRREDVEAAVRGQEAVIITASSTSLQGFRENPNYFSQGTAYAIDAMKAHGVRRLVVLSALGTGESRRLMNILVQKLVISFVLKLPFADHERQEQLVRESGLDWVIARPGRLTNGPAHKRYVASAELRRVPFSISRADVADFLVNAAERDTWIHQAVQLGG